MEGVSSLETSMLEKTQRICSQALANGCYDDRSAIIVEIGKK